MGDAFRDWLDNLDGSEDPRDIDILSSFSNWDNPSASRVRKNTMPARANRANTIIRMVEDEGKLEVVVFAEYNAPHIENTGKDYSIPSSKQAYELASILEKTLRGKDALFAERVEQELPNGEFAYRFTKISYLRESRIDLAVNDLKKELYGR